MYDVSVIGGVVVNFPTIFSDYVIFQSQVPKFWHILYWICPYHYALEGLITILFRDDETEVVDIFGATETTSEYVKSYYYEFKYKHRYKNLGILMIIFCVVRYEE